MIHPSKVLKVMHESINNPDIKFIKSRRSDVELICTLKEGVQVTVIKGLHSLYISHNSIQVLYLTETVLSTGRVAINDYADLINKDAFFNYQLINDLSGYTRADFARIPQTYKHFHDLAQIAITEYNNK